VHTYARTTLTLERLDSTHSYHRHVPTFLSVVRHLWRSFAAHHHKKTQDPSSRLAETGHRHRQRRQHTLHVSKLHSTNPATSQTQSLDVENSRQHNNKPRKSRIIIWLSSCYLTTTSHTSLLSPATTTDNVTLIHHHDYETSSRQSLCLCPGIASPTQHGCLQCGIANDECCCSFHQGRNNATVIQPRKRNFVRNFDCQ
jgi:hypothetical protein